MTAVIVVPLSCCERHFNPHSARGMTGFAFYFTSLNRYFNPHSARGMTANTNDDNYPIFGNFNPHSARGMTVTTGGQPAGGKRFQSTFRTRNDRPI